MGDGVDEPEVFDENGEMEGMSGVVADNGEGGSGGEEGMSPTEEKEIEALVELWEREQDGLGPGKNTFGANAPDEQGDGDSQEWDDIFMEVLSQEQQPPPPPQQPPASSFGQQQGLVGARHGGGHDAAGDGEMDVEMS